MTKIRVTNRKIATPEANPATHVVNNGRGTYRPFAKSSGNDDYVDSQVSRFYYNSNYKALISNTI